MDVLAAAVSIGLYLYDKNDPEIGSDASTSETSDERSSSIRISSVYLSEIAMSIPAFLSYLFKPRSLQP